MNSTPQSFYPVSDHVPSVFIPPLKSETEFNPPPKTKKLVFIIICINDNWVVTHFTCIENMKLVINKFKSGGLHEKHVVATWNLGNHLSICL